MLHYVRRILSIACLLVAGCAAETATHSTHPGVSYTYDDKFRWDRSLLDSPPRPVDGRAAVGGRLAYPPDLRRQHIQGKAIVSVFVDATGEVIDVSFSHRLHPALEEIVVGAVHGSRWEPGTKHSRPTSGAVSFPVTFVISSTR